MEIAKTIIATLKQLCSALNRANISYCLIGGLAVGIIAKPRATEDIDILILLEEKQKDSLVLLLTKHFELIQDHKIMHFEKATIWRSVIQHSSIENGGFVIVDFVFADNDIYKKAVLNPVNLEIDDVTIPIASPENLIAIKQLSNRPQDLLDIEAIRNEYFDE
ncbi:MAG: hypothetical protein Q7J27_03475 [Syntrophales bacterium]|nr:hypothetical protein [Syntrophales bacterium]